MKRDIDDFQGMLMRAGDESLCRKYRDAYTCAFIQRLFLGFKYFTVLH